MGDDVERKGLGTPATRADIIEKLVKDGFVKREKKQMIPTEDGMKLIESLDDTEAIFIIKDGRFVLEGTELLNERCFLMW